MRIMPAEWEAHECCWMAWPDNAMWDGIFPQVEAEYAAVAHTIREFEAVRVVASPKSAKNARNQLGADIDVVELPLDDAWFRDSGPSFVRQDDGGIAGVCWRFNGWGGANEVFDKDAALGRALLEHLGLPVVTSALAMEGGAIAVDGEGTLLTTDTVAFNENRNPGLTRRHAEAEFERTLGIKKTIWLPGNKDEFGTDGHVDGIACFVRPGVLLFELSAQESGSGYETTERNRRALEGEMDAKGRTIEMIFIREAPALPRQGQGDWGYCRSYVNFYVANGGVVMPKFGIPEDAAAKEAVMQAFPERKVVQVDVSTISQGGGGIHCITQQQPAV